MAVALVAGALTGGFGNNAPANAEEPSHLAVGNYVGVWLMGDRVVSLPGETTTDCQSPVAEFTPVRELACDVADMIDIDQSVGVDGVLTATVRVNGERRPGPAPGP